MAETITPHDALLKAIAVIGSQHAFARLVGVAQPSVWRWVNEGKSLPGKHVLAVEVATGISRHDLAPQFYPRDLAPFAGDALIAGRGAQ